MSKQRSVVVGTSVAGATAAETPHEAAFAGRIVLFGAESERPHERPPLSKGYARGERTQSRMSTWSRPPLRRPEACSLPGERVR